MDKEVYKRRKPQYTKLVRMMEKQGEKKTKICPVDIGHSVFVATSTIKFLKDLQIIG